MKIVLAYLVLSFLTNISAVVMAQMHTNNLPLLHFYTVAELSLLLIYFREILKHLRISGWIYGICAGFAVVSLLNSLLLQSIYTFNSYARSLEAIIIIAFCVIYLSGEELVSAAGIRFSPSAWISSGLLVYFSSSLFQFIFLNELHIYTEPATKMFIWDIHAVLVLLMYTVFTKAFINEASGK